MKSFNQIIAALAVPILFLFGCTLLSDQDSKQNMSNDQLLMDSLRLQFASAKNMEVIDSSSINANKSIKNKNESDNPNRWLKLISDSDKNDSLARVRLIELDRQVKLIKENLSDLNNDRTYINFENHNLVSRNLSEIYDNVSEIRFNKQSFDGLPKSILQFKNLKVLKFINSDISEIQGWIKELRSLTILEIYDCHIKIIPKSISKLSNLQELILFRSYIESIPSEIGELDKLKVLKISTNQISEFHSEWGNIKSLEVLEIGALKLNELPGFVLKLTNLKYLRIGENNMRSLPNGIKELKNLQKLNCVYNNFSRREKKRIQKLLPWTNITFEY